MAERRVTAAELAVLEAVLPDGLTPDMQGVANCLFVALVIQDPRAGQPAPDAKWLAMLQAFAQAVLVQLQYLCSEMGGASLYLAKGVTVALSARDRQMCREFRGDYKVLARKYNLTEMRVRQIVDAWQRELYLSRQQGLPGLD